MPILLKKQRIIFQNFAHNSTDTSCLNEVFAALLQQSFSKDSLMARCVLAQTTMKSTTKSLEKRKEDKESESEVKVQGQVVFIDRSASDPDRRRQAWSSEWWNPTGLTAPLNHAQAADQQHPPHTRGRTAVHLFRGVVTGDSGLGQ